MNINLAMIVGIAFFALGIGGFLFTLLTFDSSLYETIEMVSAMKFDMMTRGILILFGNSGVGALLFTLGKIQIALESISEK